MGCNSSAVVPLVDSDVEDGSRIRVRVKPSTPVGTTPTEGKNSFIRRTDFGALESTEPPEETLAGDFNLEQKVPPALAFEIPARENDGIITAKKQPPRRFRDVERENFTYDGMDESRAEGKGRRNEQLSTRLQTAREGNFRRSRRLVHSDAFSEENEEFER